MISAEAFVSERWISCKLTVFCMFKLFIDKHIIYKHKLEGKLSKSGNVEKVVVS